MDTENRPTAALINRSWYESAAGVLEGHKLAHLVLYAVQYVLYGIPPETEDKDIRLVFAMVRTSLDSDIAKYRERCARNSANARSKRVAASGSQWQPVAASGEQHQQQQQHQQQPQHQQKSLSPEEQIERDRFICFGYFWSIGSDNVRGELQAFWSYYESLGWKNNKGAAIVSRLAAARMWRRQFETRQPKAGAVEWFTAFKDCPIIDYGLFMAYIGAEKDPEKDGNLLVHLAVTPSYCKDVTTKAGACLEVFKRICRASSIELRPEMAEKPSSATD